MMEYVGWKGIQNAMRYIDSGESRPTLNKEVRRLQAFADQLTQEKTIWTQERIALEELARRHNAAVPG